MLKTLVKKQMMEIFRGYFYDAKKNKKRSKLSMIGYMILFGVIMIGLLGGMFTFLSMTICPALSSAGMGWLYFAIMGLLSIFLGVFGSVFNTYSGLYLAKDNDLLLAMPIPVRTLMVSRLLGVFLLGFMYAAVVIVPAVIVYWIFAPVNVSVILGGVVLIALISIFVLTLSAALGWVVAKISLKLKNKSFITVFVSLAFLGAYYFFYFKAQSMIGVLIATAAEYGGKIKGKAYLLYLFGRIGEGDWLAITLMAAIILALFAVMWTLLSRSFLKIATASGKTARAVYKEKTVKMRSVSRALLAKEFGRFTASPNYMLNCGLGILILPVCGILLLVKGGMIISILNQVFGAETGTTPVLVCTMICVLVSMNDMVVPSVSLEGKNIWLAQSLPVTPWQVLRAKLSVQLFLTGIPALFCLGCTLFVLPYSPVQILLVLLTVSAYVVFSALLGLTLGLKMPNLTWTNEIAPIKQSVAVMVAMFGGWIYSVALCGIYLMWAYKIGMVIYLTIVAALTLLISAGLYTWIKKRGTEVFAAL